MWWTALWVFVALVGVAGTVASVNSIRFERLVAREARSMAGTPANARPPVAQRATLPPPVRRYLAKAVPEGLPQLRGATLRQRGTFRPSLDGSWLPMRGEQHFSADPPGFVWWGRVRVAPGIWIDARDRSVNGTGNMLVTMESTITMADSSGPQLDQGALLRLLGEIAWLPTVFLDARYIRWSAVDEHRARAALTVNGHTVEGEFAFGADDLPVAFSAERYRDTGGGRSVLTPFVGRLSDFRAVDRLLIPYRVVGAWIVDGTVKDYANFEVERIDFDMTPPA